MLQHDASTEFLSPRLFMEAFWAAGPGKPLRKEQLLNKWLFKYGKCVAQVNWSPLETKETDLRRTSNVPLFEALP